MIGGVVECRNSYFEHDFESLVSRESTARGAAGLLHVWEAERRDRWFSRALRELSVPLTVACGLAAFPHPGRCTRALSAGASQQRASQSEQALERERYTRFAEPLPGAGVAGAR